jgi:two-component system sensor histidine kinase KdpD
LSRAILLIDRIDLFPRQLVGKLEEIFALKAVVLYERRTGEFHRASPSDLESADDQLSAVAIHGTSFSDPVRHRTIVAVGLGSEPIASLALEGAEVALSVLHGIANLVAIGLERARAQDLAQQVETARQSEQLRTTMIDAMAHEFKTPLTLIKAATTALLAGPDKPTESRKEQLTIADEEADHLRSLIDDAVDMARLDTAHIDLQLEPLDPRQTALEVVAIMQNEIDERPFEILCAEQLPTVTFDHRLMKLAIKQLVDNALKYSPPGSPVTIRVQATDKLTIEITDHGNGIPAQEQTRIFDRFYRSPSSKSQVPGFGLGLSIANRIVHAHNGDLTVTSRPGETTFRMTLPAVQTGGKG